MAADESDFDDVDFSDDLDLEGLAGQQPEMIGGRLAAVQSLQQLQQLH